MSDQKLIYIADDEDSIREALRTFILNAGFEVHDFASADALLEKFEKKPADMVILDVMMPGQFNGFAALKELRTKSTVPVILITARDGDMDYQTALDLGADNLFAKPVSPMSIVMYVRGLFRRMEYAKSDV